MESFCPRCGWFVLLFWTFQSVNLALGEAPTATLTAPNGALDRSYMHLICQVTGDPEPSITWYKNGVVLTIRARAQKFPLPGGELLRLGRILKSRHEGDYTCKASNADGTATSQTTSIKIYRVDSTPSGFPKIVKNPGYALVTSGDDGSFECNATGNPQPVITWLKESKPLDLSDPRIGIPKPGTLKITSVQDSDAGRYACVATNSLGMVYSRVATLVHRVSYKKPVITSPPQPVTVDPETVVYLNCSATGYPKPSIVWERDGVRLAGGSSDGVLTVQDIQKSGNYTCVAVNNRGEARASAYVTVRKLPFAPTRPTATQITADWITITWQPGGGPQVDSYMLYHRAKSSSQWIVIKDIRGRTSMSLKELQPYTTYQFRLFALNDLGSSKPSPLAEFTTSPKAPGTPPMNIQAKGLSDTSFEATWLPPSQPNGEILGYRLYYITDPKLKIDQWLYRASADNQTQITGLLKMTTYFFKLIAYNSAGQGPLSDLFAVKTAQGAPGQPEQVKVTVLSPRSIQVTWQAPKYSGNGVIGYEVYYNKSTAVMDTTTAVDDQTFGQEIRHLRPYTYYQVQVAATSYGVTGPKSFAKVVQTLEDVPSAAPENIRSKGLDSTSLEISWDPPPSRHRNGRITNYTVKYREKGGRASFVNVDGIKSSIRLHNLKKYTTYFVWISATTSVGTGPMSSKHTFSTAEDVPSGAPRQLKFRVVNSSTIVVRWSEPLQQQDGRIQGYSVFYQKVDDQGNQLNPPTLPEVKYSESWDSLSVVLTELEAETTYQIEVAAYTIKGDGARSVPVLAKTLAKVPDAPYISSTKPVSTPSTGLTIKWRTSVSNVLSYKLRYGKSLQRLRGRDPPVKMKEMVFLPQTKEHPFRDLNPGVWYLFKVSTKTKAGWSLETSHWVEMPPGPPSGPPLQVRASPVSSTSIRVTWLEPDVWKKNGPLIGYSVSYNPLNRRGQSLVKNITNPNQTRVLLTGLMMFTDYEIRVRALGQKGPGPLSRPVIEKTNEDVPSPPRNLVAKARSTDSVAVSWKSPQFPNGKVLSYLVIYSDDSFIPLDQWSSMGANGLNASLKALSRDTKYWIRVAAETRVGLGNYSLPVSAKTLKYDLPESCRELEVDNGGSDSVVLNWKPPVTDAGITKYQITYSGSKSYKENGEFKELSHTREVKLDAVSPGLQSHTLEGLVPHTTYKIELSAFNSMGEGPKISLTLKTDKGRPPPLQRPVIMENELSDEFVPIELEPASERNGPISYYIVVVVPLRKSNQLPKDKIPDDFFKEVRRRRDTAKRDIDEPYIAAKFSPSELPKIFNVGDKKFKNLYGYYNKELTKGSYYTMFTRAYVKNYKGETLYTSSPFVTPVKFGTSNYDGWSSWSSWGLCCSSCGQGKQHRYRFCTSVSWSMDRASTCAGKALMSRSCALNPCPECTRSNTNITMTTERGVIASPQPKESSHISRCVWRIMAKPEHRLKFTVLFYNISGFVSCSKSEVVVYDGLSSASNVLERFCFTKSNTVRYTRGRHMMVDMSLPKSIYLDFIGTYEVVKMDEGPCPTNKNLSDMSGTLTSPDFPHNYGFEHDCSWIISVPVGYHILLSFDTGDFNIHSCNKSCACDFLEVRAGATSKGKFMGNFCGGIPPSPVYVSGRESLLRFVTNKRTNNKGFRATYKAIRSLADECPRNRTFTDRRGYVHSPMFALDYPGNMECIWRIHVPKEFRVSLVFLAPINLDPNCTDFLEVRDGLDVTSPLLNRYCGSTKAPPTILSSGRAMFVRFKSDSYLRAFDGSSPGFRASYFAIRVKSGAASFLKTSLSLIPLLVFLFNHY